jgi:hypothetical protein
MRIISFIAALLLLLPAGMAHAEQCTRSEQSGCVEFDFVAVHNTASVPEIQELVSSNEPGDRKVSEVLGGDIAVHIYRAAEEGRAQYRTRCFDILIRFWNTNETPVRHMREYAMEGVSRGAPRGRALTRAFRSDGIETRNPATGASYGFDATYPLRVCGGKGALQVPWSFLAPGASIQFELVGVDAEYPHTKSHQTLWITPAQTERMRAGNTPSRWEYVIIPIVF